LVAVQPVADNVTMQPVVAWGPHSASTLPARHTLPAPLGQSLGGGRQVQLAFGCAPVHCLPAPQGVVEETPRHPFPSI